MYINHTYIIIIVRYRILLCNLLVQNLKQCSSWQQKLQKLSVTHMQYQHPGLVPEKIEKQNYIKRCII